jgi:hypothetical protein
MVPRGPGPYFSSDDLSPVLNGWQVANHRTYTAVDAGGNPYHRKRGELGIFRQNFIHVTQTGGIVPVPHAGPLRITRAPLGRRVITSAQRRGVLWFVGRHGVHGKLHLPDDTVTITHG